MRGVGGFATNAYGGSALVHRLGRMCDVGANVDGITRGRLVARE